MTRLALSQLEGWSQEDHLAAFRAFTATCQVTKSAVLSRICAAAKRQGAPDDVTARRFFETHFRAEPLAGEGILTGYFSPRYIARHSPDAIYSAPVRPPPRLDQIAAAPAAPPLSPLPPPPAEPPVLDLDALSKPLGAPPPSSADPVADLLSALTAAEPLIPTPAAPTTPSAFSSRQTVLLAEADRAQIDQTPAPDALAWMRPEDLFFMQIQGSGTLEFEDGSRLRAAYAGDNGKPFSGVARYMVQSGRLAATAVSGEGIRHWLADHPGAEAETVMIHNPRYVFFRLGPDRGGDPAGAAGVPLPPGRAIALDSSRHTYGDLYWIDAEAPVLSGAAARYRRLAIALDTGGAIRGPVRADLYFGAGDAAGREAGRVRHRLHLARLAPVEDETAEVDHATPPAASRR